MDLNPENRYAEVDDILVDLNKVQARLELKQQHKRKQKKLIVICASILGVLVIGLVAAIFMKEQDSRFNQYRPEIVEQNTAAFRTPTLLTPGDIKEQQSYEPEIDPLENEIISLEPVWYNILEEELNGLMRESLDCSQESLESYFKFINSFEKE